MRVFSVVWAVAALGCSDQRFTDLVDQDRVLEEILVDPPGLTFDALEPGETEVRFITVRNVGTTTLQLDGPPVLDTHGTECDPPAGTTADPRSPGLLKAVLL